MSSTNTVTTSNMSSDIRLPPTMLNLHAHHHGNPQKVMPENHNVTNSTSKVTMSTSADSSSQDSIFQAMKGWFNGNTSESGGNVSHVTAQNQAAAAATASSQPRQPILMGSSDDERSQYLHNMNNNNSKRSTLGGSNDSNNLNQYHNNMNHQYYHNQNFNQNQNNQYNHNQQYNPALPTRQAPHSASMVAFPKRKVQNPAPQPQQPQSQSNSVTAATPKPGPGSGQTKTQQAQTKISQEATILRNRGIVALPTMEQTEIEDVKDLDVEIYDPYPNLVTPEGQIQNQNNVTLNPDRFNMTGAAISSSNNSTASKFNNTLWETNTNVNQQIQNQNQSTDIIPGLFKLEPMKVGNIGAQLTPNLTSAAAATNINLNGPGPAAIHKSISNSSSNSQQQTQQQQTQYQQVQQQAQYQQSSSLMKNQNTALTPVSVTIGGNDNSVTSVGTVFNFQNLSNLNIDQSNNSIVQPGPTVQQQQQQYQHANQVQQNLVSNNQNYNNQQQQTSVTYHSNGTVVRTNVRTNVVQTRINGVTQNVTQQSQSQNTNTIEQTIATNTSAVTDFNKIEQTIPTAVKKAVQNQSKNYQSSSSNQKSNQVTGVQLTNDQDEPETDLIVKSIISSKQATKNSTTNNQIENDYDQREPPAPPQICSRPSKSDKPIVGVTVPKEQIQNLSMSQSNSIMSQNNNGLSNSNTNSVSCPNTVMIDEGRAGSTSNKTMSPDQRTITVSVSPTSPKNTTIKNAPMPNVIARDGNPIPNFNTLNHNLDFNLNHNDNSDIQIPQTNAMILVDQEDPVEPADSSKNATRFGGVHGFNGTSAAVQNENNYNITENTSISNATGNLTMNAAANATVNTTQNKSQNNTVSKPPTPVSPTDQSADHAKYWRLNCRHWQKAFQTSQKEQKSLDERIQRLEKQLFSTNSFADSMVAQLREEKTKNKELVQERLAESSGIGGGKKPSEGEDETPMSQKDTEALHAQLLQIKQENENFQLAQKHLDLHQSALNDQLKAESELKNMLFQENLELQRRLESFQKKETKTDAENGCCIICMENLKNVVLLPCKHMCICSDCHESCGLTQCPMCRQTIEEGMVAYL